MDTSFLRPSMLPKLALCGHFRSDDNVGEAAKRGTVMDGWFRNYIAGKTIGDGWAEASADDIEAISWAVDTARFLAREDALISEESALHIDIPGFPNGGTADLLCSPARWHADLKTGQVRNYREQMAAYALGFMDAHFCDEWTCYLLFCDQQQLITERFTREDAQECVDDALALYRSDVPPQVNDYCSWCAQRWTCPARREELGNTTQIGLEMPDFAAMDSEKLVRFAGWAAVVEEWKDEARRIIKDRVASGEKMAGVKMISKRGSKKLSTQAIEHNIKRLGTGAVLAAYGPLSETKARELWTKAPDLPFPEGDIFETPGSSYITVAKPAELMVKKIKAGKEIAA